LVCLDAVAAEAAALQTGRPNVADGLWPVGRTDR